MISAQCIVFNFLLALNHILGLTTVVAYDTMYQYNPIRGSKSIRIINLLPSYSRDDPLVIQIKEVSLDNAPTFEALSYAWEGQTPNTNIHCDDELLPIMPTCMAALRRLRRKGRSRPLWIDSICINQSSIEEKNHQVALMGEVYTKANRVIVWLGANCSAGDLLIKYIKCRRTLLYIPFHTKSPIRRIPHKFMTSWMKNLQGQ